MWTFVSIRPFISGCGSDWSWACSLEAKLYRKCRCCCGRYHASGRCKRREGSVAKKGLGKSCGCGTVVVDIDIVVIRVVHVALIASVVVAAR